MRSSALITSSCSIVLKTEIVRTVAGLSIFEHDPVTVVGVGTDNRIRAFLSKKCSLCKYITPLDAKHSSVFAYERNYGDESLLVVCNFYKQEIEWRCSKDLEGYTAILGNYEEQFIEENEITLRPYEAMMLYKKS